MGDGVGYALDLYSPAQHVALEIERAAPAALSIEQLASDYRLTFSDLSRVKLHEGFDRDDEATRWVIERAISDLEFRKSGTPQLVVEDGMVRFADGITFDDLYFHGRKLKRPAQDIHEKFKDPFNPLHGTYFEGFGIKTARLDPRHASREELKQSLLNFGWEPELPAIKDERGAILVGQRRLEIAAELRAEGHDIPDVVKTITLGNGDDADARRFRLAIVSNQGSKPFTREERASIAEYLYGDREWTQEKIAEALGTSVSTINRDLRGISHDGKIRGRGRPRAESSPEWQAVHDPIILRWIRGEVTRDEAVALGRQTGVLPCSTSPYASRRTALLDTNPVVIEFPAKEKVAEPIDEVLGDDLGESEINPVDEVTNSGIPEQTPCQHEWVCMHCGEVLGQ